MKTALLATFASLGTALIRGRILAVLTLAWFALSLPAVLLLGGGLRRKLNHNIPGADVDYSTFFDLRETLAASGPVAPVSAFAAFLLGLFIAGGWFEILHKPQGRPGLRTFCAGGGARFIRFLRLSVFSIASIALAHWICYDTPTLFLQRFLTGGTENVYFSSETGALWFGRTQTFVFAAMVAWIILITDLARASIVVRSGRSAFMAVLHGMSLFLRRPHAAISVAGASFAVELLLLLGIATGTDALWEMETTTTTLILLFVAGQAAIYIREACRAARIGGLLAIATSDADARMERRFGRFADPLIAAAGGAMTDPESE